MSRVISSRARFTSRLVTILPLLGERAGVRAVCSPIGSNLRRSERGIALVITLILLSVTLFMAIAFLAVSRRERGSVLTETDTVTARLAADSGLANAEAQILATVLQTTNTYNFGLLVSTNYINANGFNAALGVVNPTNVSYDHLVNSTLPLTAPEFVQNVANLWFLPRAPVFAYDRTTGTNEFRFYLDLNRNRQFDANGLVPVIGPFGGFLHPNGTENNNPVNVVTNFEVGDPEWIGVLERPDAPHGPNNKFLSRYAFIALPAGNTLDLNYIHNQAINTRLGPSATSDGYFRNQGVGSWEINLAAFLADLNTNEWNTVVSPYFYGQSLLPLPRVNAGAAFSDAFSLLYYRYNGTRLPFISSVLPALAGGGSVDMIPFGPPMTTLAAPFYPFPGAATPWPGADNTNHYFALASDLYNPAKTEIGIGAAPGFIDRLQFASTNLSTYDRYTFYRMLAQLGTDSAPESGRLNVNYRNVDPSGNIVPNLETNLIAWQPLQFFTNAADRMLRAYTAQWFQASPSNYLATFYGIHTNYYYTDLSGYIHTNDPTGLGLTNVLGFPNILGLTGNGIPTFGVTNIPVLVNGNFCYTPAVNRILQLAANIYDAMTNNYPVNFRPFALPTVFRPYFNVNKAFTNVFIAGFNEVGDVRTVSTDPYLSLSRPYDLANPSDFATLLPGFNRVNIFGVPMIIGAKKGFPNFNEFAMQTGFQLTRKLQVTRPSITAAASTYQVNQMFTLSVTNQLGVEFWNSYVSNYTRPTSLFVTNYLSMALTNDEGFRMGVGMVFTGTNFNPINGWLGYNPARPGSSFQVPLNATYASVPVSMYRFNGGSPFLTTDMALPFEVNVTFRGSAYPQPNWGMSVTNNLQVAMVDTVSGRIIDYAQLRGPNGSRNLSAEIITENDTGNLQGFNGLWMTNLNTQNIPYGIAYQIGISLGTAGFSTAFPQTPINENGIDGFRAFYHMGTTYNNPGVANIVAKANSTNATEAPFTATAVSYQHTTWQANDPLVHYLASDLNTPTGNGIDINYIWPGNIGLLNARYLPWGGNPLTPSADIADARNMALKDPQVTSSDSWSFPTNKFPTVGWLGRVHRGTPWQTVYLKAAGVNFNAWMSWSGNNNLYDATNMVPGTDRLLFDLFTTALNDNATRGQLPVNVAAADVNNPAAGLAAWSAVFSGIAVPTNRFGAYTVIDPAGINAAGSPLWQMVTNINYTRAHLLNLDGVAGSFEHVGDVLRTPQLTEQSPFLRPFFTSPLTNTINDAMYEWLPQQVMSLLRASNQPRFVIYSYGQTLTPAPNGIVTSGAQAGMVTNYQVTAETVTRSVIRIEGAPTNTHAVMESYNLLPPD